MKNNNFFKIKYKKKKRKYVDWFVKKEQSFFWGNVSGLGKFRARENKERARKEKKKQIEKD